MEEKTVKIGFHGDKRKSYSIQWGELLTTGEVPFESLEQLQTGTEVLAPYQYGAGNVHYSPATVIIGTKTKGGLPISE